MIKKILYGVVLLATAFVLFVGISMYIYGDPYKTVTTTLLDSISIDHSQRISVFAPKDSGIMDMFTNYDMRMTAVIPSLQSIDSASRALLESRDFEGYFKKTMDTTNEHGVRVVVLSPNSIRDYNLDFFVLFAAQEDTLPNVTLKFEVKCMTKVDRKDPANDRTRYLKCDLAEYTVNTMASSINIFDANALRAKIQTMADNNARNLEALKQEARR